MGIKALYRLPVDSARHEQIKILIEEKLILRQNKILIIKFFSLFLRVFNILDNKNKYENFQRIISSVKKDRELYIYKRTFLIQPRSLFSCKN